MSLINVKKMFFIVLCSSCLTTYFLWWKVFNKSKSNPDDKYSFKEFLPIDRFDLFFSFDEENSSSNFHRYFFVLQSIFVHQPNATVFLFASNFDSSKFRRRGFRFFTFDSFRTEILTNSSDFRENFLSIYGGTYFHFDQIILKTLPRENFVSSFLIRSNGEKSRRRFRHIDFLRCSTFVLTNSSLIYRQVEHDTMLRFFDLLKRCETLKLFLEENFRFAFEENSLIDLIFQRFYLGFDEIPLRRRNRSKTFDTSLFHRSTLIFVDQRKTSFRNENFLYFRLNETTSKEHSRWNLSMKVDRGKLTFPVGINFNQMEINKIFNEMIYQPNENTSNDLLTIELKSNQFQMKISMKIYLFSRYVSFITKDSFNNNVSFSSFKF